MSTMSNDDDDVSLVQWSDLDDLRTRLIEQAQLSSELLIVSTARGVPICARGFVAGVTKDGRVLVNAGGKNLVSIDLPSITRVAVMPEMFDD